MSDTRDYLVRELEAVADELGRVPTTVEMAKHGGVDPVVYHDEFGSWEAALEEADLNTAESSTSEERSGWSRNEDTDYDAEEDEIETESYTHIAEARTGFTPAEEAMLEDIERFYELYSRVPTEEEVASTSWMPGRDEYRRAFGGVVEAAQEAGIVDEETHHTANNTSETDAGELIDEVRRYRSLYGEVPTAEDVDGLFWTHPLSVYLEEFGDWETVLSEAGFS